ncbi:hypothetical protein PPHE_a0404 [Pseudoalteromonas phenolica O-BC30]|nr:hypothetical protein [Pseudoalteromonas phenolica O-BC30]
MHTVSEEQISEVSRQDLLSGVHVMRVTHCVHFEKLKRIKPNLAMS